MGVCVAQAAENVVSIVENCPILGQAACIYKARDFNRVEGRIGLRSKTDNQKRKKGKNKKRSSKLFKRAWQWLFGRRENRNWIGKVAITRLDL